MRRWLVASALLAATSSITQVAGKERALPKQQVQPTATLRARPSDGTIARRRIDAKRLNGTSDFRAKDLIRDICRGCSS